MEEKKLKSKVVLAETVLPVGIPGIVRGEVAQLFHHQAPTLSQTCIAVPELQVQVTGVMHVAELKVPQLPTGGLGGTEQVKFA
jgi:hypothetical protein